MTDAERLMRSYDDLLAQSPSRIAPERADTLLSTIFAGKVLDLEFTSGPANFEAALDVPKVTASFSALMSLWAVARASLQIAQAVADARRNNRLSLPVDPGTPLYEAHQLIATARGLIENPDLPWPEHLPLPQPTASSATPDAGINNLFLGAAGWVILHEIGHIHLKHEIDTIDSIRRQQEFEADLWATKWILDEAPSDQRREFRILCITTGLVWLGLINTVRRATISHPPAAQRLLNCTDEFLRDDLSPALEMAGDVLKVVFDPSADLSPSEHPADAFVQIALHLRSLT